MLETAVSCAGIGILVFDRRGRLASWDVAAAELFDLGSGDGQDVVSCLRHADGTSLDPLEHPALATLDSGIGLRDVVFAVERANGQLRWVSMSTRLIPEGCDGAGGMVATVLDVTAAREAQRDLERLAMVARFTADAVIICDAGGNIAWVNDAFTRLFGWTCDQCVGERPGRKLQGPETDPNTVIEIRNTLRSGRPYRGEILNYRQDGSSLWIELTITPVADQRGRVTHFVSLAHDITVRRTSARRMFQLSAAVSATDDGIAVIDAVQEFRFANDSYAQLFGYERGDELLGASWRSLFDDEQLARFDGVVLPNLWTGDRWRGEVVGRRRDGTTYPLEISLTLLPGGSMVTVIRDITERKRREAEQARLTAILEATPDLVAISASDGAVPYMNSAGRRMLGVEQVECLTLDRFFPDRERARVRDVAIPAAEAGGVWCGETTVKRSDGSEMPVSQVIVAHRNALGEVEYHSTIMRDITERKEAEDALRKMSLQDQLTGLFNRHGFFMLAQQALNSARTHTGYCILLYFDLNDFKQVNDTYGHHVGDEALQEVAQVLQETFRDSDVLGRLGGDEFVALAVNCLDQSGQVLLSRLDERLGEHNARPGRKFKLSMGRGLTRFDPDRPRNLQQMLEEADALLYEDKRVRKAAIRAASMPAAEGA